MNSKTKQLVVGGVPEHFNLPWHQCIESGAFEKAGFDVKFVEVAGGTGAMTRGLREKELDIALVLAEGGVADLLKGNPSSVVKTYVESPLIWGIHVGAQCDINTIEEIRGRSFAISRIGSGSHLMAIVDASERGWPTDDLEFKKIGNLDGARKALTSGEADVFLWERFTTEPYVESGEFRRLAERRTLWPAFLVCVRDEVLSSKGPAVKQVLSIVNEACADLMKNPHACDIIAERYKLRIEAVKEWFGQTKWSTGFDKPADAIAKIKTYLQKLNIVSEEQANSREVWFDLG